MHSLDLFSGVGGITRALEGFACPRLYCERDPHACQVLKKLMAKGKLPKAPIHNDVVTLNGNTLRGKVQLIAAGFPCVGFSTAGNQDGFENAQSSLYKHVVRLVREVQPPFVFLENVPGILKLGVQEVARTMTSMGYILWWLVIPAWAVGGVQKRSRWFCLAVHPNKIGTHIQSLKPWKWYNWKKEPVPRMVPDYSEELKRRVGMMGNSVVPDCVRMAFMLLWTGCTIPAPQVKALQKLKLTLPETLATPPSAASMSTPPKYGAAMSKKGAIVPIAGPTGLRGRPNLRILIDPHTFKNPKSYTPSMPLTSGKVRTVQQIDHWATPRHAVGYIGARTLTNRCMRDLGSQLRFARDTPDAIRSGYTNPDWVDWLMGFPVGWTKFT